LRQLVALHFVCRCLNVKLRPPTRVPVSSF